MSAADVTSNVGYLQYVLWYLLLVGAEWEMPFTSWREPESWVSAEFSDWPRSMLLSASLLLMYSKVSPYTCGFFFFFFFGLNTFENIWQTLQCRNLTYSIYTCVLEVTQDNIPNQVKTETLRHSSETQTVWVSFTSSHPACYGWENQKSALPAEDFFPHPLILPRFLFLLDGAVLSSDFPQILLSTVVLGSPLATFRSRARRCNLSTSTSQIV